MISYLSITHIFYLLDIFFAAHLVLFIFQSTRFQVIFVSHLFFRNHSTNDIHSTNTDRKPKTQYHEIYLIHAMHRNITLHIANYLCYHLWDGFYHVNTVFFGHQAPYRSFVAPLHSMTSCNICQYLFDNKSNLQCKNTKLFW